MAKKSMGKYVLLCILAFVAFFAFCQTACADYKELMHKGWHKHNDSFSIDSYIFTVKAGGVPTKAIISVKDVIVVVENGTCVDKLNMSLCLTNVKYPEFELHRLYDPEDYEYYVEIWYYLANITIAKEMEKEELMIGEKIRVEVEIKNDGSLVAGDVDFRDIYFSDYYPDFFISNVYGCSFSKHNITWSGSLRPNQVKTCSYDLQATKATTFKSMATATYFVGIDNRTKAVSSKLITIKVPDYELDFKKSINSTSVWVGDYLDFNITVNNTLADKSFEPVALMVEVPQGLDLIEYSDAFSPTGNMLRWSGRINPSEAKDFWAMFRVRHSGNNPIKTNLNYKMNTLVRFFDEFDNVTGLMDELGFQYISFTDKAKSGSAARFEVNINNPSSRYVFKNVKINISANLPISFEPVTLEEVGKKQFVSLIAQNITLPDVDDITHYSINFDVRYKTEFGQEVHLNETKYVTINPKEAVQETAGGIAETRKAVRQKMGEIGMSNLIIIIIILGVVFIASALYFIRQIKKKMGAYDQYKEE